MRQGHDPCAARRKRRRQVDADQDLVRRRAAGFRHASESTDSRCSFANRRPKRNDAGIACIFQELSLLPDLTVADNIGITRPPGRFGLIDRRAQRRMAEEALARVGGEDIHP